MTAEIFTTNVGLLDQALAARAAVMGGQGQVDTLMIDHLLTGPSSRALTAPFEVIHEGRNFVVEPSSEPLSKAVAMAFSGGSGSPASGRGYKLGR